MSSDSHVAEGPIPSIAGERGASLDPSVSSGCRISGRQCQMAPMEDVLWDYLSRDVSFSSVIAFLVNLNIVQILHKTPALKTLN